MSHCPTLFVTGTDTGIGKTVVTTLLMRFMLGQGARVSGMKPVASGAVSTPQGLRNDDAVQISALCNPPQPYERVNPYTLAAPIAPHIAAALEQVSPSLDTLLEKAGELQATADYCVIEGVGGWRVPWSDTFTARDFVAALSVPVLLVVGLRLGCINHALLTVEAMQHDGIHVLGWLGNEIDRDYQEKSRTLAYLQETLAVPYFGCQPFSRDSSSPDLSSGVDWQRLSSTLA